jgi:hypothetical protein
MDQHRALSVPDAALRQSVSVLKGRLAGAGYPTTALHSLGAQLRLDARVLRKHPHTGPRTTGNTTLVPRRGGMSLQQPSQPVPAQQPGTTVASGALPPVMLYLPSLSQSPNNSAFRIAQLIAIKASKGPGTYAVEGLPSPNMHLTDGRRIVKAGSGPVLDIYTVDYRPLLRLPEVAGSGIGATLRRLAFALWYFFRTLLLVLSARNRAKSRVAKWQLLIGFGAVVVLLLSVVFTVLAVLAALGLWEEPPVSGNAADAIAIGATALVSWLFFPEARSFR